MQHECPMFNTGKGAEQALVRRLDTQIVPMVMELYLEAFLDRVNIGIARLYEIEEDLNLVGDQYQISVSLLFVIYLQQGETAGWQKFHWRDVKVGATDWRTWAFAAAQYGVNTMWYYYSTFLPTIIKAIGSWTSAQVQLLTIDCYCLGAIIYLVVARKSDSQGRRGLYCIAFIIVSIVGYALLNADVSAGPHYFSSESSLLRWMPQQELHLCHACIRVYFQLGQQWSSVAEHDAFACGSKLEYPSAKAGMVKSKVCSGWAWWKVI
ncbi:putative Major facilitator superfamily domain-containing protein [Seiridium cardinale]|uniref:Major facilitator superfamily domain-containing protein n=1 Tax=Seiridium cardinale TaxID=138064 RepID=A0ABR2XTT4_9PEZI